MKKAKSESKLVSPKQAAFECAVHGSQLYDAARRGLLEVVREGERTLITRKSLDRWKSGLLVKRRLRDEEREVRGAYV